MSVYDICIATAVLAFAVLAIMTIYVSIVQEHLAEMKELVEESAWADKEKVEALDERKYTPSKPEHLAPVDADFFIMPDGTKIHRASTMKRRR
mgnify:FL=1|jgi:hypothetical protein